MSNQPLQHVGFYNQQIETARLTNPEEYARIMNQIFANQIKIWHLSWWDLEKKINQFKTGWNRQWNVLYQTENEERFPGIETKEQIEELAKRLEKQGRRRFGFHKIFFSIKHSISKYFS